MLNEKVLYRISVTGRVQGVGYRWSAVHEARLRGINGYVRNMPDGSVYIEAEGYPEQLDGFIEWCKKGPATGFVKTVTFIEATAVQYRDFTVR